MEICIDYRRDGGEVAIRALENRRMRLLDNFPLLFWFVEHLDF